MKTLRLALLSLALVMLTAAPAAAATPALGAERFWFYWIAPILVLSGIGMIAFLALGYYVRVLRPRSRGR
ncbi:MAG: hypothetical protein ACRDY4_13635 [Acidimicrobiia bacterium]